MQHHTLMLWKAQPNLKCLVIFTHLILCIYEQPEHKLNYLRIEQSVKFLFGIMGFCAKLQ